MADLILVLKCFVKIGWELVLPAAGLALVSLIVLVLTDALKGDKK